MTHEDDLDIIEKLVDKGISFQREGKHKDAIVYFCLLYTSPSPRDAHESRMPSSA